MLPLRAAAAVHVVSELPVNAAATGPLARLGRMRWRVCALLLAATTINYVDRQVLGVLAPFLQTQIGWNEINTATLSPPSRPRMRLACCAAAR